jgi:hypothetical protein
MNIEFFGDEPQLDDIQVMSSLQQQAKFHAQANNDIQRCADNLLAALFYVRLVEIPKFNRNLFTCRAQILCRIGPSHDALRELAKRLKDTDAHFYLDFEQKVSCVDEESYKSLELGSCFSRNISFKVMSLADCIDIKIDGITARARSISNCPYKIQTMIEDEELDCVFGSRNSRKRPQPQMARDLKRGRFR